MADVVGGFLRGRQAKQQEEAGQMRMQGYLQQQNMLKAQQRKQERFQGALTELYQGTPYEDMAEFGQEGVQAVGQLQQHQAQQAKAMQEGAALEIQNALPFAFGADDAEWEEAKPWLIEKGIQAGIPENAIQSFAAMGAEEGKDALAQAFGVERPKEERMPVSGIENVVMPDGSQKSFDIGVPAERVAYQAAIEEGALPQPTRQEVGGAGEFDLTKKQFEGLKEAEIATKSAIATANKMLEMPDEAFQDTASFARVMSGAGAEIAALVDMVGLAEGETLESLTDATRYTSEFERLGIDSAIAQGHALDLALAYAGAIGLGEGRALTDKDVARALNRIGVGGLKTPAARRASIESVRDVLGERFNIRYETLTKKPYGGDLGIPTGEAVVQEFTEGQRVRQGGKTFEFRNGEWIEVQ